MMSSTLFKRKNTERNNREECGVPVMADLPRPYEDDEIKDVRHDTTGSEIHLFESAASKKTKHEKSVCVINHRDQQHSGFHTREETKFPLSYIGMIAQAINSSSEKKLILADIYNYMERHFFPYLSSKPRWKNTVRHNLSFHKCFIKCECSRKGNRSHYWSIHPDFVAQFNRGNFSKTLDPPPFARYEMSSGPWVSQQLNSLNPLQLPPSIPVAPTAFPYETVAQYDTYSATKGNSFLQFIPTNSNPTPGNIIQPFTLARQFPAKFYPEAAPKSFQYPRHYLPISWPVHKPSSSKGMPAYHEMYPSGVASSITPQSLPH